MRFEAPDVDVSWSGIESLAGTLYMLGTSLDGDGVLYALTIDIPLSVPVARGSNASDSTIPAALEAQLEARLAELAIVASAE